MPNYISSRHHHQRQQHIHIRAIAFRQIADGCRWYTRGNNKSTYKNIQQTIKQFSSAFDNLENEKQNITKRWRRNGENEDEQLSAHVCNTFDIFVTALSLSCFSNTHFNLKIHDWNASTHTHTQQKCNNRKNDKYFRLFYWCELTTIKRDKITERDCKRWLTMRKWKEKETKANKTQQQQHQLR